MEDGGRNPHWFASGDMLAAAGLDLHAIVLVGDEVAAPRDVLEEPEEHLDAPPLSGDLREQLRWKIKPVGHDPKSSITARPLHPSVAFVRLHLHANQPNRMIRPTSKRPTLAELHGLVARPCGAQYRRSSHRATLPISTGWPPKPLMVPDGP